jgi:hypothetical protein
MENSEATEIGATLNLTHAELMHSEAPSLASAPELALYRLAMGPYDKGYALALLEDAGMLADADERCLFLNTNSLAALLQRLDVVTIENRDHSVTLFALHETFHLIQGVPDHGNIRRIKQLGAGWLISFLDLRSTSHAANLLADLLVLRTGGAANDNARDEIFRKLWIESGHASLRAFPIYNNPSKCQRFMGHLMTSVLLLNPGLWPSWSTRDVLWPVWSANDDEVMILSKNVNVIVPPSPVSRATLRAAIECLYAGDIDGALPSVRTLVEHLHPSATIKGP